MTSNLSHRFSMLLLKRLTACTISFGLFYSSGHAQAFFRDEGFMTHLAWELNDTYDSISRIAQISFPWSNQMMLVGGIGQQYVTFGSGSAYMGSTSWMLFDMEGNWNPDFKLNSGGGGCETKTIWFLRRFYFFLWFGVFSFGF